MKAENTKGRRSFGEGEGERKRPGREGACIVGLVTKTEQMN